MLDAYAVKVLRAYKDKKTKDSLSPNLSSSTPARLKDECIMVLAERYKLGDEKLLRMIFGYKENLDAYLKAIEKQTEKFKPLNNFLKGITVDPEDRVIDLLALLIGFEPRPVIMGYEVNTGKKGSGTTTEGLGKRIIKKGSNFLKTRNTGIILTVVILICAGIYLLVNLLNSEAVQPVKKLTGNEKYMYWTGDHYLAIPHKEIHGDTPVVPLDTQVLNHLKRIIDTTSINYNALGKVWYARLHRNHYEYFTDSGFHPIDTAIRLRPITRFIIDTHILNHKN